jgi:hypothetical protein
MTGRFSENPDNLQCPKLIRDGIQGAPNAEERMLKKQITRLLLHKEKYEKGICTWHVASLA